MSIESQFFQSLLDNFHDGVYFVDRSRCITYWNKSAERITGYSADDAVGVRCQDELLVHVDAAGTRLCQSHCPIAATIDDGVPREANVFLHHKQGHRVPVAVRVAPIHEPDGAIIGAIEVFNDNSSRMEILQRVEDLEKIAYVDPLTGLANRSLTDITLRGRFDELARYGWPFGVLFIDIDHFKRVNDVHGHDAGDAVLQTVARTLRGASRSFDLTGRWGGEEFLAILANADAEKLAAVAERYRVLVEQSQVATGDVRISVTVSIGGAVATAGDSTEGLVHRADAAMYRSKQGGRNRVTIANP